MQLVFCVSIILLDYYCMNKVMCFLIKCLHCARGTWFKYIFSDNQNDWQEQLFKFPDRIKSVLNISNFWDCSFLHPPKLSMHYLKHSFCFCFSEMVHLFLMSNTKVSPLILHYFTAWKLFNLNLNLIFFWFLAAQNLRTRVSWSPTGCICCNTFWDIDKNLLWSYC